MILEPYLAIFPGTFDSGPIGTISSLNSIPHPVLRRTIMPLFCEPKYIVLSSTYPPEINIQLAITWSPFRSVISLMFTERTFTKLFGSIHSLPQESKTIILSVKLSELSTTALFSERLIFKSLIFPGTPLFT